VKHHVNGLQVFGTAVLIISVFVTGCKPEYESLSIEPKTNAPKAMTLNEERIVITEGIAVLVEVEPVSGSRRDFGYDTKIELESKDDEVFEALPTDDDDEFVLIGVTPGETCMDVWVADEHRECISVQVSAAEG